MIPLYDANTELHSSKVCSVLSWSMPKPWESARFASMILFLGNCLEYPECQGKSGKSRNRIHSHTHTYIHYITLHYVTLQYSTVQYITLHYITYIYIYNYDYHLSTMMMIDHLDVYILKKYLKSMEIFRLLKRDDSGLWILAAKRLHGKLLLSPSENKNMYITLEFTLINTGMTCFFLQSQLEWYEHMVDSMFDISWLFFKQHQLIDEQETRGSSRGQKWEPSAAILTVDTSKAIIQLPAL